MNLRHLSFCLTFSVFACGPSGESPGPGDASNDATRETSTDAPSDVAFDGHDGAASESCACKDCVCGLVQGSACAQQFASTDCLQGGCCVLSPDAGPPYYDDAGGCPGSCFSPDDMGCTHWFRSNVCAGGDLCCAPASDAGDAGAGD